MLRSYFISIAEEAFLSAFGMLPNRRVTNIQRARKYREGYQPKRLKVTPSLSDDNIIINFSGLVVERAVSLLLGEGVKFDLPGQGETEQDKWLTKVWEVNNQFEILNDVADYGASSGTPVILFDNESVYSEGVFYPELSCLDPSNLEIKTDPMNYKRVLAYIITYKITVEDIAFAAPKESHRRRLIEPSYGTDEEKGIVQFWNITDQELVGNRWVQVGDVREWEFEWPPILAWKNLPNPGSQYGKPDLTEDVLDVQDAINLVASNINKVMRLQAHQRIWSKFFKQKASPKVNQSGANTGDGGMDILEFGPDKVVNAENEHAEMHAIEANSSFQDMTLFLHELRDALFSIARSTDPSSLKDKVGQITNFGLRILYKDALDKVKTKQHLYGEAFKETNRRLLELGGYEDTDPGEVKWGNPLPENQSEVTAGQKFELDQGLTSKQTIREERGRDNEVETERLKKDQEEKNKENANIGGMRLNNFNKGSG